MRRVARHLAVMLVAASVFVGVSVSPAAANSAVGLAQNAWLVSDLAVEAHNAYMGWNSSNPGSTLPASQAAAASTATRASTTSGGFRSGPSSSSKLGLVVNGIAVLGTAAFMFWPGEDAPEIPGGTDPNGPWSGSDTLGFTQGSYAGVPFGTAPTGTRIDLRFQTGVTPQSLGVPDNQGFWAVDPALTSWSNSTLPNGCRWVRASVNCGSGVLKEAQPKEYAIYFGSVVGTVSPGMLTRVGTLVMPGSSTPAPAPPPSGDPATIPRYVETTITCKSPGGGSQTITRTDGPFTFDPAVPGAMVGEVPDMVCPEGTWLDSGSRHLKTDGTTETVPIETYDAPNWVDVQADRFPECMPIGSTACQLTLAFVGTGGALKNCSSYPLGAENPCYRWLRDPDRAERFQCQFGPYLIGLRACRPLKDRFNPTPTINPSDPLDPAAPDPDDPEEVDPDIPPVDPTPETTPDLNSDGCIPQGWDLLNPFAYFKATACALKWAFVPKVSLSTRVATLRNGLETKIPFSWLTPLSVLAVPDIGETCPDWVVHVGDFNTNVVCDSSFTAAIRAARPVLLGFMGLLAVWPLIRSTAYAAFPIIKPQPGMLR